MDELTNALAEIEHIRKRHAEDTRRVIALLEFIKRTCHHPEDKLVKKQQYIEGSYYDVSRTEEWVECSICGAKSEVKTIHGYYA